MKSVRVQYCVNEKYVDQNKTNIQLVMKELRANPILGMNYSAFYLGNGNFMHVNVCKDGETMAKLNELASFIHFRSSLQASGPVSPPKSEDLELVGSNHLPD